MYTNKLERYSELKVEIATLEKELEELKVEIMPEVELLGEVIVPLGRFSITKLNRWTYTPAVKELEEAVKIKKIEEEEKGIAKVTVINSMTFKANKI